MLLIVFMAVRVVTRSDLKTPPAMCRGLTSANRVWVHIFV